MPRVKVKTPASTANLGPGFDVLGLALGLHNTIEFKTGAGGLNLTIDGEGADLLLRHPDDNLVFRSVRRFYEFLGTDVPPLDIHMSDEVPLSRGLGSSSATIVAALAGANAFAGAGMDEETVFNLAAEVEGHADNVAAAFYGGLTIAYRGNRGFKAQKIRPAPNVGVAAIIPEAGLATVKARAVVPGEFTRDQAVFNISRVSLLIYALTSGDLSAMATAVEDALHQPPRRRLMPDFDAALEACYSAGAAGVALSGAGPTLVAFYDREKEAALTLELPAALKSAGLQRAIKFLDIDYDGARVEVL